MKKNILIISQHFYPEIGSAGNRMKNMYQLLEKEYTVSVLTTEPSYPNKSIYEDNEFWDEPKFNSQLIHRVKIKSRKYSRSIINRLLYYLEITIKMLFFIMKNKKEYDLIVASSPPIFIGIVGLMAKWRYKSKLILDIRDLWPESLKGVGVFNYKIIIWLLRLIEKLLYKKSNTILVNSKGFINYIQENYKISLEKILFLPNSAREIELEMYTKKTESIRKRVIFAGNIGLAQDVSLLMKVAEGLQKNNIHLDIIGYGMKHVDLRNFTEINRLENVHFLSTKTRKKCLEVISNYPAGIATLNDKEVFKTVLPGRIIDYMTCGVPVVAAVSGYSEQVILNNDVGYVTNTRNVDELINYIMEILSSETTIHRMSTNAVNCVKRDFLWEENIKELYDNIEKLLP
ncbi:glycosyl transferase family 1 [Alkalihalobacillus alcalophilus ATCC 27647 = CGMCC 1.3604]|uniref:Glycosyl transferase family 1 n=1 Tax=Alkalihalobacillus alcalophilus ATCC 27647 = CGMCC 1.3604 TaxID=1218173 RepID=A0A094WJ74_ALKAL|nr:glycosyltransferase family 4 protein [Alkalihalobacillus alcalophilus]KGA96891.1 glycosyl transferase group 1 protein [Alkalihalobacillus alcalophilus ATCC 27647 = CGMCC 1.3604]MED1562644.1 glycosyltransferase family 4 protein [Alkalihalobacillus alcalophilus]THG88596.1 glycosyl transferase family 1 [Alkalihalobacillus alcalophilus ATCC 27647 = CGMCC 1.3604]